MPGVSENGPLWGTCRLSLRDSPVAPPGPPQRCWTEIQVVRIRRLKDDNPNDVRLDVRITVVLSVLLLALGVVNLWQANFFPAFGSFFGGSVFLWLAYRNYRIAKELGWFPARGSGQGDVNSNDVDREP